MIKQNQQIVFSHKIPKILISIAICVFPLLSKGQSFNYLETNYKIGFGLGLSYAFSDINIKYSNNSYIYTPSISLEYHIDNGKHSSFLSGEIKEMGFIKYQNNSDTSTLVRQINTQSSINYKLKLWNDDAYIFLGVGFGFSPFNNISVYCDDEPISSTGWYDKSYNFFLIHAIVSGGVSINKCLSIKYEYFLTNLFNDYTFHSYNCSADVKLSHISLRFSVPYNKKTTLQKTL